MDRTRKLEIRNSNDESNSNDQNSKRSWFRHSNFEFDSSFEFRISNLLLCALCVLCATNVPANALSLPLQGYFHPGRAMPVRWEDSQAVQLSASGSITTHLEAVDQSRGIFPWIVIAPNVADVSDRTLPPLHPLEDSDCLVADAVSNDSDARSLFPNRRMIGIHVDADELTGPAMAWETLDAILLTPAGFQSIPQPMCRDLFAEGIELAVLSDRQPDARLPWNRSGKWWIASAGMGLPPIVCADAYAPTYGWPAGRSQAFRTRIFLFGAIYCLLVCGVGLWRSRWMPAGIVAASLLAAAGFAFDNQRQSPIFQRSGIVRLIGPATMEDDWLYQVSHRPTQFTLPLENSVHPIFCDESQPESLCLTLDCDGRGRPTAITGRLSADEPLALMRRRMPTQPTDLIPPTRSATSPLRLLATESIYPGFSLAGQIDPPTTDDSWPTVVLRQKERGHSRFLSPQP
jgi:hypothetical protein